MLVFVIDDNPDDRALVLHQLKAALPEAEAREIGDAQGLEDALSHERPSLVITDLALGWTSGLDILARMKALDPDCPVIMFTGAGDEQVVVQAMKAGLDDYVVKSPKRLDRLRASIHDVVEKALRKAPVRPPDAQPPGSGHKGQPADELYGRVHKELSSVIDLLRTSADQQADPNIADQFAQAASRVGAVVEMLGAFDRNGTRAAEGSGG